MDIWAILTAKPVLIGLHLGFAILGIDAFLWLLGEIMADFGSSARRMWVSFIGLAAYVLTWLIGGYYYVTYYGPLVKPVIKSGSAPWAHAVAMEAKEHIFLFLIPMAVTIYLLAKLDNNELKSLGLKNSMICLVMTVSGMGLSLGLMGFIISAAARFGAIVK